nr:collagen alpha-1(I) chain-like [Manis javanica]
MRECACPKATRPVFASFAEPGNPGRMPLSTHLLSGGLWPAASQAGTWRLHPWGPSAEATRPSRGRALASWGHGAHGGGGCRARLGRDLGGRGTPSAPSPPCSDPTAQAEASAPRAGEGTPSPACRARSPGEEALFAALPGHAGPRGCSVAGVRGAPGPAARVLPRSGLLSARASAAWFSGFLWTSPAPLNQDPRSNKIPGDCSARWLRGNGELQTAFGRDVAAFSLLFHTARMKFKQWLQS